MKTLASCHTRASWPPRLLGALLLGTLLLDGLLVVLPRTTAGRAETCSSAITVVAASDGGAGSLRQAMLDLCPSGTIDFDLASGSTITLASQQLQIT